MRFGTSTVSITKHTVLISWVHHDFIFRLYKKDKVIEFLLDKSKFEQAENFEHIRGLKVNMTPNVLRYLNLFMSTVLLKLIYSLGV